MRISDWSSDVCSSDLQAVQSHLPAGKGPAGAGLAELEAIGGTMELLFREYPYLKSCEATVTASGPQGVRLDRTVFYPQGGGHPLDCGDLVLPDSARLRVVDAVKGEGHEELVHLLEEGAAPPPPVTLTTEELDLIRSYRKTTILNS